jgi:hypothetical protein
MQLPPPAFTPLCLSVSFFPSPTQLWHPPPLAAFSPERGGSNVWEHSVINQFPTGGNWRKERGPLGVCLHRNYVCLHSYCTSVCIQYCTLPLQFSSRPLLFIFIATGVCLHRNFRLSTHQLLSAHQLLFVYTSIPVVYAAIFVVYIHCNFCCLNRKLCWSTQIFPFLYTVQQLFFVFTVILVVYTAIFVVYTEISVV